MSTELIEHQKISALVDNYRQVQADVAQAFALLQGAKDRMEAAFGGYNCSLFEGSSLPELSLRQGAAKSEKKIRKQAWDYIFTVLELRSFISEKRYRDLQRQLQENKLPEITTETVYATLESVHSTIQELMTEAVVELFDQLRSRNSGYVTNKLFAVGEKVILCHIFDVRYGFTLSHHDDQVLRSMDNVFHLLDGKGSPKYPHDLVTHVREAMQQEEQFCETDYFFCKWYKLGTMHIRFKRLDLLKKLNEIGGKAHEPTIGREK